MDYLRQIEEDLRNVGIEAKLKKKYPEVLDSSERALDALKAIREVYVSEIMRKNKSAKLPQSSDILAPYLLVCNYAEGSAKVTLMALNGINLLLTYDLVPPSEVKNIMRALSIQASSKIVDVQLKLLQVVLQLANSLAQNPDSAQYLTESIFCGFLTLALQLCDSGSKSNTLSVSSTALGTARQIIAFVMDGAKALFATGTATTEVNVDQASSKYSLTAIMLVREVCLFVQGLPGEWIRGVTIPQAYALDLLTEILTEWKQLFRKVPFFKALIRDSVFPALKPLLKGLQEDYVRSAAKNASSATQMVSKVVKLARCLLLNFVVDAYADGHSSSSEKQQEAGNLNSEASFIISMLVHALQPDRAGGGGAIAHASDDPAAASTASTAPQESTFKSRWEEASSVVAGAGMFLSRLTNPTASSSSSAPSPVTSGSGGPGSSALKSGNSKGSAAGSLGALGGAGSGFYLNLSGPSGGVTGMPFNSASAAALLATAGAAGSSWLGGGAGPAQLPAFPATCCLEALLAFLLSDLSPLLADSGQPAHETSSAAAGASPSKPGNYDSALSKAGSGLHLFETLLVNTMLGLCTFLQSALTTDSNLRELEANLKGSSALSKLLRGLLTGTYDHDKGEAPATHTSTASTGAISSCDKHIRSIHELIHGATQVNAGAPADLLLLALYLFQFIPRMMLTLSLQLVTGGENRPRSLRRSNSSSATTGDRRVFLSSAVALLINPSSSPSHRGVAARGADGPFALPRLLKNDASVGHALRSCISRVCDSVYESTLDTCSLLLNAAGDTGLVRAALEIIAELAIISGTMDQPKQCDIIISVLCKYTVPMWHGQELYGGCASSSFAAIEADPTGDGTPRGLSAAASKRESVIRWRHYQAFVRLSQVIHLIADTVPDWDNIVDAFEQLVDFFMNCKSPHVSAGLDLRSPDATASSNAQSASDKELFLPEVEKIFTAIERFKAYSVFLSDEGLVRLTTSLVALSMNHLAVNASSSNMSSSNLDGDSSDGSNSDIIQVSSSPFTSSGAAGSAGMAVGSGAGAGGAGAAAGSGGNNGICRVRPESSSAGLSYMTEGIRNGTISFSLQALIEITKLNAFRISTIWQMVISHLRMIASLKSANSRAISVAATHDVILSSMRYQQLCVNPITGLRFLQDEALVPHTRALSAASTDAAEDKSSSGGASANNSLVMTDELLFNFVLPSFDTVFVGRDIHRIGLEGRDDRLSSRPALSQNDLLSSLKALSSVRYSDVRSAIIEGLAQLLQGRGQIVRGGSTGGWPVIIDLISSVPLSMANVATVPLGEATPNQGASNWVYATDEAVDGVEPADDLSKIASNDNLAALDAEALSTLPETPGGAAAGKGAGAAGFSSSGAMASLSAVGVIPQYQWPLESLVSAFTCMKLIVDEFFEVLVADCELVSAVLHGLALFGSQVKDANISLTSVEMLWKVTDLAITYARSNHELRLSDQVITSQHYVAVVFDIMLKRLFQLSMDPQPLIRHCAMNTLFSAMSTHAPIISAEQWQQVFGNIIFPLFERAGARSRIAMWSKEEAIAPELKKGVKMSVHHSRDTAHKQWSETRVIALRGLSRVLRTCTRLLLQESWFRVIWVDALNVCQGALQAACDEQEVSIAALDVVFTMLRIIIQTDSASPAGSSEVALHPEKAPTQSVSRSNSKLTAVAGAGGSPSVAIPALSKDEVENIERCKLALWQLTWTAVRTTAFFTCNSVELALAISQKLKELYKSRIDHEFRYSDNVRVLLEILVALVRPRVGILRGTTTSASAGTALPDLITQKQDRVAESQLQRAVIDLLCVIQPADGLAQSCLMSTLTEICFSVLWVQVPVAPQSEATDLSKSVLPGAADSEWLILGAAPERLRKEAGEHLGRLLVLQFASEEAAATSPGELAVPSSPGKLFAWASASTPFISLMIDIVVRRFVADICEGPLVARCSAVVATSAPTTFIGADGGKITSGDVTSAPSAGFFAAFGSIMNSFSSPTAQNLQPVYAKHVGAAQSGPVIASARIAGGTLHKFVKYIPAAAESKTLPDCTPFALSLATPHCAETSSTAATIEWRTFYLVDTELKLLLASVQACYSLMSNPYADSRAQGGGAPGGEVMTEAVWNSLLTATACLLSPWRSAELCSKTSPPTSSGAHPPAGAATKTVILSDFTTAPSADIANILKVSLKIIDFMRYPLPMTLQWTDILVRSTVLGMHVLGEACASASAGAGDSGHSNEHNGDSRDSREGHLRAVGEFYQGLWLQVASVLGSLLAAEEEADIAVRSRALWGTIEIANASIRAILRVAGSAGNREVPHSLLVICEEFLRLLQRSSSTPAMMALVGAIEVTSLSGAAGAGDPAVVDSLVAAWMQSSKVQARDSSKGDAKAAASGAKVSAKVGGTPKPRKSVTANSAEGALGPQSGADADGAVLSSPRSGAADKGHVVLLLPLCLDLVLSSCNAPELKAVAVALIKSVDLVQLSNSVQALSNEAEQLRARNRKLEHDMAALRSANTLPF